MGRGRRGGAPPFFLSEELLNGNPQTNAYYTLGRGKNFFLPQFESEFQNLERGVAKSQNGQNAKCGIALPGNTWVSKMDSALL